MNQYPIIWANHIRKKGWYPMKNIIKQKWQHFQVIFVLLLACLAGQAVAKDSEPQSYEVQQRKLQLIEKHFTASEADFSTDNLLNTFLLQRRGSYLKILDKYRFESELKKELLQNALLELKQAANEDLKTLNGQLNERHLDLTQQYMDEFSLAELEELDRFYTSDLWQKVVKKVSLQAQKRQKILAEFNEMIKPLIIDHSSTLIAKATVIEARQ